MKLKDTFTYGRPVFAYNIIKDLGRTRARWFIAIFLVCSFSIATVGWWHVYQNYRASKGDPISWDQIPPGIRDEFPPEIVNQLKK